MLKIKNSSLKKITDANGSFFEFCSERPFSEQTFLIGGFEDLSEYTAVYRFNACWMMPCCGKNYLNDLDEIQYLIMTDGKKYSLLYALIDQVCRTSFYIKDGLLYALCETGDPSTTVSSTVGMYCIEGDNPYELTRLASTEIVKNLKTCNLVEDKIKPKFLDKFGLCTYNALGCDVNEMSLDNLLCVFKNADVQIGFLLIDDGWQKKSGNKLSGFAPNAEQFPHGLKATIAYLKEKYGLSEILCWHTFIGYWTGLLKEEFPDYKIEDIDFYIPEHSKKMMHKLETAETTATAGFNFYAENLLNEKWGVVTTDLYRFYFDFYSYLRSQGVDGSKLDAMAWIEALGKDKGGRVKKMRELVSSLEGASAVNFNEEHINCSSCSNDFFYNSLKSCVVRSSIDFFEYVGSSHGTHLFTNAHTSFWLNEMFIPDWDMFMSGIAAGEFHAMARAISGGPIYCSDNIKSVNMDVIRRLTDGKGGVCRCLQAARVTKSNLFTDPVHNKKLLKIFNKNTNGYVLGAFCCYYDENENVFVKDTVALKDIYQLPQGKYAVYSYRNGYIGIFDESAEFDITLGRFEGEIYTVVPVVNGKAVIGVIDKYNPAGYVDNVVCEENKVSFTVKAEGTVILVSDCKPQFASVPFEYENGVIQAKCVSGTVEFCFG